MKKFLASLKYALNGLAFAFRNEGHFRFHLMAFVLVTFAGIFFSISRLEWIAIFIVSGVVLLAELFNTAIEQLCDFMHKENDPRIGAIKDIAAGAVFIATLLAITTGFFIFVKHLTTF